MIFRVRFSIQGGHVHCRLFSAKAPNMTFAKCGDFCVTKGEEMQSLVRCMSGVQFLGDDEETHLQEACSLRPRRKRSR